METPGKLLQPIRVQPVLMGWVGLALLFTVALHATSLGRPFDYAHAWVSAHFSTMARAFSEHGVVALGGLPIQNNPPLGAEPDAYIHWPPLFPMVLQAAFRLFGESEAVASHVMLVILLGNALLLGAVVTACAGRQAGLAASFALLVMPVTLTYGRLVVHIHLAIMGMLLALLAFLRATGGARIVRGWAALGTVSLGVAVASSWEPVLMCPGLLAATLWRRRPAEVKLAWGYCGVATLVCLGVLGLYVIGAPDLVAELWHTVMYRAGLAPYEPLHPLNPHTLFRTGEYAPNPSRLNLLGLFAARIELAGQLPLIALGWVLVSAWARRQDLGGPTPLAFAALLAPWVLWFTVMFNHACLHEYEMAIAAPPLAAAVGLGAGALLDLGHHPHHHPGQRVARPMALVVLPAVMLFSMAAQVKTTGPQRENRKLIDYARELQVATAPGGVVMVPFNSMIPVYYSKRHVIRGVANDTLAEHVGDRLGELFPEAPVYLAIDPGQRTQFRRALRRYPIVVESSRLVLLAVPYGAEAPQRRKRVGDQQSGTTTRRAMATPGTGEPAATFHAPFRRTPPRE